MAHDGKHLLSLPPVRPPPFLFPPPEGPVSASPPPYEPLMGRLRARSRATGAPEVERYAVILESLMPDPDRALERLLEAQRAEGAQLTRHWRLDARDLGSGAHEVRFEPVGGAARESEFVASGFFGQGRVELALLLAHASATEQAGLQQAMKTGGPFKVIVLSHQEDTE